jgi:alkanesulfonate monooxygenase SsuD/methylene tetrahydromethanopterin reductase-like flavin-dependent oxidoreductase (luciferase family)
LDEQARRIETYRRAIVGARPVGKFVNESVSLTNFLYCDADPERGNRLGKALADRYSEIAGQALSVREVYPTAAYATRAPQWKLRLELQEAGKKHEGLCVGSPDEIIRAIEGWRSVGVDGVNFLVNAMEMLPQEEVLRSLRLFAKEVMPAFRITPAKSPARAGA